jgi:flavin reductase (DIM6/NTAB) family NADH-FMN oxidoreductase RutF
MDFTCGLESGLKELSAHGAFLTAASDEGVNTMTVSWGFVGFMWQAPHFITVVRPDRFTRRILDRADSFTVSVPFGNTLVKELKICGFQSGRDIDKSKVVTFAPARRVTSPVVAGCNLYYECERVTAQPLDGDKLPPNIVKTFYKDDFHIMYFGKIVDVTHRT